MNFRFVLFFLCLPAAAYPLLAEVRVPALFSDHMVLQSREPASVWGWASPGEKVTVAIGGQSQSATAGPDGKWTLKLGALEASAQPLTMTIAGSNTITINDVLIGEVWLCSGQSNMAMQVDGLHGTVDRAAEEIAAADLPQLRLFTYDQLYDIYQLDAPPRQPLAERPGRWWVCSPATAAHFSAMGYFVGRTLNQKLKIPLGMIISAVGGTPIEAWTSLDAQKADPALQPVLSSWEKELAGYDPAAEFAKYAEAKAAWLKERAALTKEGKPFPKAPPPFKNRQVMAPAGLFNGLINPLVPYTMRGVLWYQGERNAAGPLTELYGQQLEALIKDWRARWGSELFFAWVQLANFQKPSTAPSQDKGWGVWVRDGMRKALAIPNTGMAVTIDLGGEKAGHPTNKQEYAERLALVVMHGAYKSSDPGWSGPLYESFQKEGDKITVTFKHAEGLRAGNGELKGFAIAGSDRKFVWGQAQIENGKVVVRAPGVSDPVSVRYNWAANPSGNLENAAGLPASPFRTDDWPNTAAVLPASAQADLP